MGGVLHGFLGGNRQSGDFLRLVIGAAQIFRFGGYPLFPRKIRDHVGKGFLVGNQSAQSRFLRLTAQIFSASTSAAPSFRMVFSFQERSSVREIRSRA